MKAIRLLAISALIVAGGLTGCSASTVATASDAGGPARVGTGEFATVIDQPGVVIIDVRTLRSSPTATSPAR